MPGLCQRVELKQKECGQRLGRAVGPRAGVGSCPCHTGDIAWICNAFMEPGGDLLV